MNQIISAENNFNKVLNKNSKKKKRIFYLDQIRALAIMLVILNHICAKFITVHEIGTIGWIIPTIFQGINAMGVPLFLMISGALLLNREYELKDYFKRRFVRLVLPIIFWGIILILLNPMFGFPYLGHNTTYPNMTIWFLNKGYWFCWMLIGIYLFIPIINSFIREYKYGREYFLVIWLIYIILMNFKLYPLGQLDLSYFAGYMGFLVMGNLLHENKFNLSDRRIYLIGILIFIIFTALNCHLRLLDFPYKSIYNRNGVLILIQSIGIFLFFKYFEKHSENNLKSLTNKIYLFFKDSIIGKITFSISIASYGIYLSHYIFLHMGFVGFNDNVFKIFSVSPIKGIPCVFIIVLFLSWILVLIVSKIPYLKKWSGMG